MVIFRYKSLMLRILQQTLSKPIKFIGKGLHTGKDSLINIMPGLANQGTSGVTAAQHQQSGNKQGSGTGNNSRGKIEYPIYHWSEMAALEG